jgi:diguanylate cyclase (GGDEF)-like protein
MNVEQTTCTIQESPQATEPTLWTACLVIVRGIGTGNKVLLNNPETSIGRADEVNLRLAKAGVSRRHAVVKRINEQQFLLCDQQSTNGTFVNAERIDELLLKDQDLIAIGESRLKFISADSPEQAYYEDLYCQAQLDKALQIYNKHYFLNRLDEELRRQQRFDAPLALIMLDVDHFKALNDRYGHLAGDAALIQLADCVKQRIRETDVLCRYGGEEFGIIMPQTNQQQAALVAEQIRLRVAATPVLYADLVINVTISLGISGHPGPEPHACTREALIAQADKALYAAKRAGRNQVASFETAMLSVGASASA